MPEPFISVTLIPMADEGSFRSGELGSRVNAIIQEVIGYYVHDLSQSMNRAAALVFFAQELSSRDPSGAQDVLRAVVVLNHAYLEDLLRTLATTLLPDAGEKVLNKIPLAGTIEQADKFHLGALITHKGKLVDDLIRESVSEYLERSTFNTASDIADLLVKLGFKVEDHNQEFPQLEKMMRRRHQIVHRADRVKTSESKAYTLEPIALAQVQAWLNATANFVRSLMQPLLQKVYPPEKLAEMLNIRLVQK